MSKIEWTDVTWNPVTGCAKVSEGCRNCYAERMAKRLRGRCGYPADDPFRVTLHPGRLDQPMRWRKPRIVFACSMGDLFHENVPLAYVMSVLLAMRSSPRHTFLLLTKRPGQARDTLGQCAASVAGSWPLPNVWLGVSIEDQAAANERIPILLDTPAAHRFVSVEPLLEEIRFSENPHSRICGVCCDAAAYSLDLPAFAERCFKCPSGSLSSLDWVICGGETGPGARPMPPDWARLLRDQCREAGVPFFFKQMSGRATTPEDLAVREWPRELTQEDCYEQTRM